MDYSIRNLTNPGKSPPSHPHPLRLAAIGDIHCTERSAGVMQNLFNGIEERADVLLLCGDLTDRGRPAEMAVLLPCLRNPIQKGLVVIAVLGNHDYHSGEEKMLVHMMRDSGIRVFFKDDNLYVHNEEVGFVGIKGYWGGFSPNTVAAFGEQSAKEVMRETAEDAKRLAKGLRSLNTPVKVAIMHYAPIRETLRGEPAELFPVLGTEWLAKPLDEEGATVCFHGHAHYGSYNGLTRTGVPVYNVAAPLLRRNSLPMPSIHTV